MCSQRNIFLFRTGIELRVAEYISEDSAAIIIIIWSQDYFVELYAGELSQRNIFYSGLG